MTSTKTTTYLNVFTIYSSSLIDAPRDKIWSILMDFESYKDWNPFVRSIEMVTPSKARLPDQTPAVGQHMQISVHIPPSLGKPGWFGKQGAFVVMSILEPENYRVSWTVAGLPRIILNSQRWQILTIDDRTGKTKYENFEVFGGLAAYFVRFFFGSKLRVAFQVAADSLKKRAEET